MAIEQKQDYKKELKENFIRNELTDIKNNVIYFGLDALQQKARRSRKNGEVPTVVNYSNVLAQRDKELYNEKDMTDFINTKRNNFETSYNDSKSGIKQNIGQLSALLYKKFNINTERKSPVQILSIAMQTLAQEKDMGALNEYTQKLSGEFDINFINCYGYIQSLTSGTWTQNRITRELNGVIGFRTIYAIHEKLTKGKFDNIQTNPTNFESNNPQHVSNTDDGISLDDIILDDEENSSNPSTTPTENTNTSDESSDPIQEEATTQPAGLQGSGNGGLLNLDDIEDDTEDNTDNNNNEENHNDAPTINGNGGDDNLQDNTNRESNNPLDNLSQYGYVDEDVDISTNMTWNAELLSKRLDQSNLDNISYQEIIDVVNGFNNNNLKKIVMYHLLKNNIIEAQKVLGMDVNCDNHYRDYIAGKKLGKNELSKMAKLGTFRRYEDAKKILNNDEDTNEIKIPDDVIDIYHNDEDTNETKIPDDVIDIYQKFLSKELNNGGKNYAILSKFDYRVYLFSSDNYLLSRQNVVVGSTPGDQKNDIKKGIHTTPGGLYQIGGKYENYAGKDFFKIYGTHYIVLSPLEDQYDTQNDTYSMGIHGDFKLDKDRKQKLISENSRDHRGSNGCVNTDSDTFGEIYNHLEYGGKFYVTHEK